MHCLLQSLLTLHAQSYSNSRCMLHDHHATCHNASCIFIIPRSFIHLFSYVTTDNENSHETIWTMSGD